MDTENTAGADDEFARRLAASAPPAGEPTPDAEVAPEAPVAPPAFRAPEFFGADELAAPPAVPAPVVPAPAVAPLAEPVAPAGPPAFVAPPAPAAAPPTSSTPASAAPPAYVAPPSYTSPPAYTPPPAFPPQATPAGTSSSASDPVSAPPSTPAVPLFTSPADAVEPPAGPSVARSSYLPPTPADGSPVIARHAVPEPPSPERQLPQPESPQPESLTPQASPYLAGAPQPESEASPAFPAVNPYLAPQPASDLSSAHAPSPAATTPAAPSPVAPSQVATPPSEPSVDTVLTERVESVPAHAPWAPQYSAPTSAHAEPSAATGTAVPAPESSESSSVPAFIPPVYGGASVATSPSWSTPTPAASPPDVSPPIASAPADVPTFSEPTPAVSMPIIAPSEPDPQPEPGLDASAAPEQAGPVAWSLDDGDREDPLDVAADRQPEAADPDPWEPITAQTAEPDVVPAAGDAGVEPFIADTAAAEAEPPQPAPETAEIDRFAALFEPTGPSPIVTQAEPQPRPAAAEPIPLNEPMPEVVPLVEPTAAPRSEVPLPTSVYPIPAVDDAPDPGRAEPSPTSDPETAASLPDREAPHVEREAPPTWQSPAAESVAPEVVMSAAPTAPPPTAPAYAPTATPQTQRPLDAKVPPASVPRSGAGSPGARPPVTGGSPAILGLVDPDAPPVPDQAQLARSSTFEKASLAASVLPVIGLGVAAAAAAGSSRRRGWVVGVAKAAIAVGIVSTLIGGVGGVLAYQEYKKQQQHAAVEAASAEFCATVAANPTMIELPTFGWPAPGASIADSLVTMQAYQDSFTALAAVSPQGIVSDVSQVATAAGTIIQSVTVSRTLDDASNVAQMSAVASNSGLPAWAAEYCG